MKDKIQNFSKQTYLKIKTRVKEISLIRYIKTNVLFITFVLINLFNSWLLRIVTMGNLFSFKGIISDLAFILIISNSFLSISNTPGTIISFFLKKQIRVWMPLTIVMTAACIINAVYYENYVSFASFSLLSTASFLGDMNGDIVTGLIHLKDVILIFLSTFKQSI